MNPLGVAGIGFALFMYAAAYLNWDWFFESRRSRLFVSMLGRFGTRIFYAVLGTVFLVAGIWTMFQ